jgi:cell division protein YceG involved in septum cleavage
MENTPKRIIAIIVISFLIVGVITIFPVKIIQTTENGQHTGIVTAVEIGFSSKQMLNQVKKMSIVL